MLCNPSEPQSTRIDSTRFDDARLDTRKKTDCAPLHLHAARDALRAHVGDELQRAAQLLPRAAQRDHGGVAVGVAQPRERMLLR